MSRIVFVLAENHIMIGQIFAVSWNQTRCSRSVEKLSILEQPKYYKYNVVYGCSCRAVI